MVIVASSSFTRRRPLRMSRALFVTLMLAVLRSPVAFASGEPNLILEAGFDAAQGYVQAQASYTLRLYQAVDVRELTMHDPVAALAELRPIGEDRIDEITRNGRRYRVTERRYAVFPFASGDLVLSGAHVTGRVAALGASGATRESVRLEAPPAILHVLPIPPQAADWDWLPARALSLTEGWQPSPDAARAGEPLRRTLRIEALGLDAAQLPELRFTAPGFAVYPERPRLENRFEGELNLGAREQSYRVVPLHAGPLTMPALHLPWWDVTADRPRRAKLAPQALAVAPAATFFENATPENASASSEDPVPIAAPVPREAQPRNEGTVRAIAFIVAGVTVISLGWNAWRLLARAGRSPLRMLRRACRRNDAPAARHALRRWGAERWPEAPPRSLGELAGRVSDPQIRAALLELDRHLYGPSGSPWQGRALVGFPGRAGKGPISPPAAEDLPPLYPR